MRTTACNVYNFVARWSQLIPYAIVFCLCCLTYLVVIEEHIQLRDTYTQVGLVELVPHVPAERAELPPLLHDRVEEAQREQQLLEHFRLFVAFEPLGVVDGIALVRPRDVCAKTCGVIYITKYSVNSEQIIS